VRKNYEQMNRGGARKGKNT